MSLLDDPVALERLLSALERIAMALELSTGLSRPEEEPFDASGTPLPRNDGVSYTSDLDEFIREERKEAYFRRTGRLLGPEEDVPRPSEAEWPSAEAPQEAKEGG